MIVLGWAVVFGLPLIVFIVAVFWPERIPKDRTVQAIRQRIESEDDPSEYHDY
ncbi:hypothetical protein ACQP2U_11255 [Nocardia sp. CA-084685]|uniref:hypothetical protein n=1 Tax=Nocardia sp. CA-084685 TaxID=3239970 RepID=UPI003D952A76